MELMELMAVEMPESRPQVLVVDDSLSSASLMNQILSNHGCTIRMATSGQEAVSIMSAINVDLLILDWRMPQFDGGDTLRSIETVRNPLSGALPFVLYTGVDPAEIDLPHTKKSHLIDFWRKTDQIDVWHNRAKNLLKRLRRRV